MMEKMEGGETYACDWMVLSAFNSEQTFRGHLKLYLPWCLLGQKAEFREVMSQESPGSDSVPGSMAFV